MTGKTRDNICPDVRWKMDPWTCRFLVLVRSCFWCSSFSLDLVMSLNFAAEAPGVSDSDFAASLKAENLLLYDLLYA